MINKIFLWLLCLVAFLPLGADIAVLIEYNHERESWWLYLVILPLTLLSILTDGFKA